MFPTFLIVGELTGLGFHHCTRSNNCPEITHMILDLMILNNFGSHILLCTFSIHPPSTILYSSDQNDTHVYLSSYNEALVTFPVEIISGFLF